MGVRKNARLATDIERGFKGASVQMQSALSPEALVACRTWDPPAGLIRILKNIANINRLDKKLSFS
jgi:hypothetical protein